MRTRTEVYSCGIVLFCVSLSIVFRQAEGYFLILSDSEYRTYSAAEEDCADRYDGYLTAISDLTADQYLSLLDHVPYYRRFWVYWEDTDSLEYNVCRKPYSFTSDHIRLECRLIRGNSNTDYPYLCTTDTRPPDDDYGTIYWRDYTTHAPPSTTEHTPGTTPEAETTPSSNKNTSEVQIGVKAEKQSGNGGVVGLKYKYILGLLAEVHGILMSLRTLKRILRGEGLFRRRFHTDILQAALFIEEKISSEGNQQGYRWMHLQCLQHGIRIPRDHVHVLMQVLDPVGVELRLRKRLKRRQYSAKGPDYVWHVDSYDKLKRYGLCVNGCIDGFSRHIVWLKVYKTSSNPRVIAGYYIEAVHERGGCPSKMRGDRGTENGHVAQMQQFLTDKDSFLYGRSTSNQRIEMFWSFLRKQCCQYWMDALGLLASEGKFTGDYLDVSLIQFCCMDILQREVDDMVEVWNAHHIRCSRNQNGPHGRPIVMYRLPSVYNTQSHIRPVESSKIEVCKSECTFRDQCACDSDVKELCEIMMTEHGWERPSTLEEALILYSLLRSEVNNELEL